MNSTYPNQIVERDDFVVIVTSGTETGVIANLNQNTRGELGFDDPQFFDLLERTRFGHVMCSLDHVDIPDNNEDFRAFQDYETGDQDVPVVIFGNANTASLVCMLVGAK